MATLYIVATPIGNLEDITLRALRILKEVDFILCEDTRVTQKLLARYNISTPTLSYHEHSKITRVEQIIDFLNQGKNLAFVSDAGTPGISDPGGKLIAYVRDRIPDAPVVPVPGASAVTAAASIAGFSMDKFVFMGFPPAKRKRKKFFEEVCTARYPVIFYESPYRILKTLKELEVMARDLEVVVCREVTKKFETVYRGNVKDVLADISNHKPKGEFVVITRMR